MRHKNEELSASKYQGYEPKTDQWKRPDPVPVPYFRIWNRSVVNRKEPEPELAIPAPEDILILTPRLLLHNTGYKY